MALPNPYEKRISPEDYLNEERRSPVKREYLRGRVVAFAGASPAHHQIVFHLAGILVEGRQAKLVIPSIGCTIPLAEVYEGVL